MKIQNISSQIKFPLKYGVPQGLILSPFLCAIYILPLKHILKNHPTVKYNLYADDIDLHRHFNGLTELLKRHTKLVTPKSQHYLNLNKNETYQFY